jgi:hypothetical protein
VPTPIECRSTRMPGSGSKTNIIMLAGCLLMLAGCGEPSARALKNRQEFEALLTAVSLKNKTELALMLNLPC